MADLIADRLSKKYQLQLDKEIERFKTELNTKEYVSKTKFDAEFRMYQELSEKNVSIVYKSGEAILVVRGAQYSDSEIERFMACFCELLNDAELTNKRYAPFVSEDIYNKYLSIEKKASNILTFLKYWKAYSNGEIFSITLFGTVFHNRDEIKTAIEATQKALSAESNDLLIELRDYLSKLDVLND